MNTPKSPPKQIIVMRSDLGMRKGKMIAQGAHASMKALLDQKPPQAIRVLLRVFRPLFWLLGVRDELFAFTVGKEGAAWLRNRFTKICVRVDSESELLEVFEKAKQANLPCALIEDAGLTEFHGVPTKTCCAIGPADPNHLDPITKTLRLF